MYEEHNTHLYCLSMVPKDIDPNNRFIEIGIRALRNIVIQMLFIPQRVHPFEHELKEGLEILRAGTRYEDIRIPMR